MLHFYNTAGRKKEKFIPIKKGFVKMYTCGPTIYDHAHIGNLSTYLFMDILRRYLKFSKYKVLDVMNFTDVDDKTIKFSKQKGVPLKKYTKKFGKSILNDFRKLNINKPKIICKATKHIQEMINLIEILLKKGYAYQASDKSVYFNISKFRNYGKFAKVKRKKLLNGASGRILSDEYNKENVSDFVLWKTWDKDDGNVFWNSPFGKGRPGWHIECSAMSMKYLGPSFDIHTGAVDLIFPHHQNEIAQSEAATGKKFVKYWLHRGFLQVNKNKMSKSLGNLYVLDEILKKVDDPMAFRYLVLTSHYRKSLNFTFSSLKSSKRALDRIREFTERVLSQQNKSKNNKKNLIEIKKETKKARNNFIKAMDDDLNTSKAIAGIFNFVNKINKLIDKNMVDKGGIKLIYLFIKEIDQVWGFLIPKKQKASKTKHKDKIKELIKKRNKLRQLKNWEKADKIKTKLIKMGVELKDTSQKTIWKIK